jgi:hypothetical protein
VLRYGTAIDKQLHKAMDRLRQVLADRRVAEAAAVEGTTCRGVKTTKRSHRAGRAAGHRVRGQGPESLPWWPWRRSPMEAKIKRAALPSEKVLNRIGRRRPPTSAHDVARSGT